MRQTIKKNILFISFFGLFEILLFLQPLDIFPQDTINKTKVLTAYKTSPSNFNLFPHYCEFPIGQRIAIKTLVCNQSIKGKLVSFSDSSIMVKDSTIKQVFLSDIKSLKKIRGRTILHTGLIITGLSGLSYLFFNRLEEYYYKQSGYSDDYSAGYLGQQMFSILIMFVGINTIIVSVIDNMTATKYKADKNWKYCVITKN